MVKYDFFLLEERANTFTKSAKELSLPSVDRVILIMVQYHCLVLTKNSLYSAAAEAPSSQAPGIVGSPLVDYHLYIFAPRIKIRHNPPATCYSTY